MLQEKFKKSLKDKRVAIIGGTGSFGKAFLAYVKDFDLSEIRIISRDEAKQELLRQSYSNAKISYRICDVRDERAMLDCLNRIDHVFFAAALKQVPSCEFYPVEAVKTNIYGAYNVIKACNLNKVQSAVFLSTDKAVYPINAMGQSKALMEKTVIAFSKKEFYQGCNFVVTRYGNVMHSRGSVLPLFKNQITNGLPLTITSKKMTRFMMSLQDSVELVLHAMLKGDPGSIFISKAPGATLKTLLEALEIIYNKKLKSNIIGVRIGEKMYETLVSSEEMLVVNETKEHFEIPIMSTYQNFEGYYSTGSYFDRNREFNSQNTLQLTPAELALKIEEAWKE